MRRAFTVVLAALPFDARGRRALDETLLDWAAEQSAASRLREQIVANVRGCLAVLRAVTTLTAREMIRVPYTAFLGRLAVLVAIPLVTLNLMAWMQMPNDAHWRSLYAEAGVINGIALYALLAPSQSISWLPLALAGAAAWSLRARPGIVVGLSCAAAVLMCVVLAVGEPLANRTFGEWARAIQPPEQVAFSWSAPGEPETLGTRVVERWRTSDVATSFWFVVFDVAPVPLAAALVLMAGLVSRAPSRRYWLWWCLTPALWFGGTALWHVLYRMPGEYCRPYFFWIGELAPWLLAFALFARIVRTQTLVRT